MKKIVFGLAAVSAVLTAPLGAQWKAMNDPNAINNDGGQFWDNLSLDGPASGNVCNVGYVLTGVAGTTDCTNQRPAGWLPYTGAHPDQYLNNGSGGWVGFGFTPGDYSFNIIQGSTPCCDIALTNSAWGYWDGTHATTWDMNASFVGSKTFSGVWGLWIDLVGGGRAYSDTQPQIALFGFALHSNEWIAGFENTAGSSSDYDYNDTFLGITADNGGRTEVVPEPASMTLLATGLAGMAAAGLRRRRNRK